MRRPPADEPSSVNYHALEGGGWYPPEHAEIQQRPKGSSVATRVIIAVIAIALLVGCGFAGYRFYQHRKHQVNGIHVKRIIQRHNEKHHHGEPIHGPNPAFVTKELDLEEMEHANFDPEVAAAYHEDGLEEADLGYWAGGDYGMGHDPVAEGETHDGSHIVHAGEFKADEHFNEAANAQHHEAWNSEHPHHEHHNGVHVGDEAVAPHVRHLSEHEPSSQDTQHHAPHADSGVYHKMAERDDSMQHHLHVKDRIKQLFPLIDTNGDHFLTDNELRAWTLGNGLNATRRRTKHDFEYSDTDKDGKLSLAEYVAELLPGSFHGNETVAEVEASPVWAEQEQDWVANSKVQFKLADVDGDGALNEEEHYDFQHPEESGNPALHAHLLAEDIRDRAGDHHKDRITFAEFMEGLWHNFDLFDHAVEFDSMEEHEARQKALAEVKFKELDVDRDEFLTAEELRPVFHTLHPTEAEYADLQASHMIHSADDDGDKRLTLEEMLNNPYVFYSAAVDDEEESWHDEF